MEKRGWLVAHLPSDAFRLSRFASDHPDADVQVLHLGQDSQQGDLVHRLLLRLQGDDRTWRSLRGFLTEEVGAIWQDLPSEHHAILGFTAETQIGHRTRALLDLWPLASVSCLRCRGDRTDIYAIAADPNAAKTLAQELRKTFATVGVKVRTLDAEERTWCRRMLDSPALMTAMNR